MEVRGMTGTDDRRASRRIFPGPYARRHPRTVAGVRLAVAIWLLVLAGIFCSRGYYWGLALVAPAVLHVWLAYRLRAMIQIQH
jgi:hypothetical protein